MKEIKLQNNTYLFVEIPDDATNIIITKDNTFGNRVYYDNSKFGTFEFDCKYVKISDNFKIISTTKDITEKQAESIVEKFEQKIGWGLDGNKSKLNSIVLFQNYTYTKPVPVTFLHNTAKESLQSLIQANELDVTKNYLILRKL